ncbi:hypothetical protein TSTA_109990 [Talaromyces stipitatus ATCC 10500]|uniref:Nucleoside phosphorylase domain-containing protein n=1 Tax=Talaromyces stipitatus (strain ATCC 10500 / CBS 375.48 / QM 6759 / NRRL 1006) TaxID=441959 RepID=B8MUT1_TALSN|nr:uncharacterized protein TSTA_109990 [Talaromyces stipitatus ATCC 10500]EED11819.1 hypothetical protein TSTA_109990 [Talaromyces stipitatus ATCC 10500]
MDLPPNANRPPKRLKRSTTEPLAGFAHGDYTVGWICALPETELVAAMAMLDERHPSLPATNPHDANSYVLGQIGDHNVVIACLPAAITGKVSAATIAKDMIHSFPAVRFGLMVGIGGGAPYYGAKRNNDYAGGEEEEEDSKDSKNNPEDIHNIRLSNVVISLHLKSLDAVVQYDFGKSLQEKESIRSGSKTHGLIPLSGHPRDQPYTAATAASYAKEFLLAISGLGVKRMDPIKQSM